MSHSFSSPCPKTTVFKVILTLLIVRVKSWLLPSCLPPPKAHDYGNKQELMQKLMKWEVLSAYLRPWYSHSRPLSNWSFIIKVQHFPPSFFFLFLPCFIPFTFLLQGMHVEIQSGKKKRNPKRKSIKIQKHDSLELESLELPQSPCTQPYHSANVSSSKHALSNGLTGPTVAEAM